MKSAERGPYHDTPRKRLQISTNAMYLSAMRQYEYQPCIPTFGTKVPAGPDWLHESNKEANSSA